MARKKTPRKRLGHIEQRRVQSILRRIRAFKLAKSEKYNHETAINKRLIKHLRKFDPAITNKNIGATKFVSETFRPECCLKGNGGYYLLGIECKRLKTAKPAKRLWKEGLSQALLYLRMYKRVFLVLYDFTPNRGYSKKFGKGNKDESRFANWAREKLGLYIVVLSPSA